MQVVSQCLPHYWKHLKINLAYNDRIKTFYDVGHNVLLENEHPKDGKVIRISWIEKYLVKHILLNPTLKECHVCQHPILYEFN